MQDAMYVYVEDIIVLVTYATDFQVVDSILKEYKVMTEFKLNPKMSVACDSVAGEASL